MDKYGLYVYWAFGITIISTTLMAVSCWLDYKKTKARIKQRTQ